MNEKNLFILNINELNKEEIYFYFFNKLEISKQNFINSYKNKNDKLLKLGEIILLEYIFNLYDIRNKEILYDQFNKPYILNNEIYFNISHSKEFVAIIISFNNEVGIDIQYIKDVNKNIIYKMFHKDEISDLIKINDNYILNNQIIKLWTIKESVVKCLKDTKHLLFNSFYININNNYSIIDGLHNFINVNYKNIYIYEYNLNNNYYLFISSLSKINNINFKHISINELK